MLSVNTTIPFWFASTTLIVPWDTPPSAGRLSVAMIEAYHLLWSKWDFDRFAKRELSSDDGLAVAERVVDIY